MRLKGNTRLSRESLSIVLFLALLVSWSPSEAEVVTQSLANTLETLEDLSHPCARKCVAGDNRVCRYTFKVEWYITMSKACFDCPFNLTDCARPHCAPADGFERPLVTVNRRLPGPALHVCVGDEMIVDVVNELGSDSTSIHWHGLHQQGTPYMDGVPFLTQCPIPAGNSFRYHFLADHPGTHYWHSHSGLQRTDGMFGSLVIREPEEQDPLKEHYDEDDFEHMFVITDWLDALGIDKFVNHHHTEHDNKPYTLLVNGRGKHVMFERDDVQAYTPVHEVVVKPGKRHRFRALSNSIQNCPIVISVEGHKLLAIATDGMPIQPIEVDSLTIFGGERWDFVVNATEEVAPYWIYFQGQLDCDDRFKSAFQVAVMRYEGAQGYPTSLQNVTYESTIPEGLNLNKLNAAPGDGTFVTAAEIRGLEEDEAIARKPDYQFWLDFDFYSKNNELFHHEEHYPFFGVQRSHRVYLPQINDISLRLPSVPPLSQPEGVDVERDFCNATSKGEVCSDSFCYCPHVLSVEKDSLIELVLVDEGVVYWANHPFHLHGHTFKVLAMGRLGEETTMKKVKELDAAGQIERNFDNPPTKDTVTVPDGGYTIIRFFATNPGYWLFHCHISFHVEVGMGLVFRVGDQSMVPPVPENFPRCGHWTPDPDPNFKAKVMRYVEGQTQVTVDFDLLANSSDHAPGPSYSTPVRRPTKAPSRAKGTYGTNGGSTLASASSGYLSSLLLALALARGFCHA